MLKTVFGYFAYKKTLQEFKTIENEKFLKLFNKAFISLLPNRKNNCILVQSEIFGTPAIFGLKNIIIILPHTLYADEELNLIFQHELLHLKHRDFLIKIIIKFLLTIHWWNPFLHRLLFPAVNQVQELFVDYAICKNMTDIEKVTYLEVLHKSIKYSHNSKVNNEHVYPLVDEKKHSTIIQRLQYIMSNKKSFSLISILFSILIFLFSFTFIFEPLHRPKYDETGSKVFYYSESNSYYIKIGKNYDLYLNNEFVFASTEILEEFKTLPIYNDSEEIK